MSEWIPWLVAWSVAVCGSVPLGMTLFNLAVWPRGRARSRSRVPRISVCIPARNEERDIEACVRAAAASRVDLHEIVVLDDNSEDRTPAILARLAKEIPILRVHTHREPLPEGWVGKVHACHLLQHAARGEVLLFVDADTRLTPDGLARLLDLRARFGAEAVSAVPRQVTGTFFERLMMPLLHLTYTSWLPMPLVWLTHDPRFLAANGQVMLLSASALREVGGFAAIRTEIVDDMALMRAFKRHRHRVVFADGQEMAATRMYRSAAELWSGFSKNAYEGIGGSLGAMLFVLGLYLACFVAPYGLAAAALAVPAWWVPAAVGLGANLLLRTALALRFGHAAASVLLHPIAVVLLGGLLVNSRRLFLADRIQWRGRVYVGRDRVAAAREPAA